MLDGSGTPCCRKKNDLSIEGEHPGASTRLAVELVRNANMTYLERPRDIFLSPDL